jgi:hypothetical protein
MPKYIVEQISVHRSVFVVEADNQEDAKKVAAVADDNWQQWLGQLDVDVNEYSEERIAYFKHKDYFWDGVSYKDSDGYLAYHHPSGEDIERKEIVIR